MGKKGEPEKKHTLEEKIDLSTKVCDLYSSQNATLKSCCDAVGVSENTFYYWTVHVEEVKELYKKAKESSTEIYWDKLRQKAQKSLERLIEGEKYFETKSESGIAASGPIEKTTISEVVVLPNPTSVIFALKGEYPGRFSDRVQHTGENGDPIKFENVSLEDKLAALALLEGRKNGE